jgi:hypothetical protein
MTERDGTATSGGLKMLTKCSICRYSRIGLADWQCFAHILLLRNFSFPQCWYPPEQQVRAYSAKLGQTAKLTHWHSCLLPYRSARLKRVWSRQGMAMATCQHACTNKRWINIATWHTCQASVHGRFFFLAKSLWLLNIGYSRTTVRYPFRDV